MDGRGSGSALDGLRRSLLTLLVLSIVASTIELHQAPHWSLDPDSAPVIRFLDAHQPGWPSHFHAVLGFEETGCLGCLQSLLYGGSALERATAHTAPDASVLRNLAASLVPRRSREHFVEERGPPQA